MKLKHIVFSAFLALSLGTISPANAAPILLDGTFLNPIGIGGNLTPWADWTGAGITTHSASGFGLPGNYANLPTNGTPSGSSDLYQAFLNPSQGLYDLTFYANNFADYTAHLVVGMWIGNTPTKIAVIDLPALSGFLFESYLVDINVPAGTSNQFWFGNSYDQNPIFAGSINPAGTNIGVANVSLVEHVAQPIPEPATWAMMLLGLLGFGLVTYRSRRRMDILSKPLTQQTGN